MELPNLFVELRVLSANSRCSRYDVLIVGAEFSLFSELVFTSVDSQEIPITYEAVSQKRATCLPAR